MFGFPNSRQPLTAIAAETPQARAAATCIASSKSASGSSAAYLIASVPVLAHIGVQQDHCRYLRASSSYRVPARSAARNWPRQREANDGRPSSVARRSDCSISLESDTPLERAYCLAAGTRSASTVMVSFCFIVRGYPFFQYTDFIREYTYMGIWFKAICTM